MDSNTSKLIRECHLLQRSTIDSPVTEVDWNDQYFRTEIMPNSYINEAITAAEAVDAAKSALSWYIDNFAPADAFGAVFRVLAGMTAPQDVETRLHKCIESALMCSPGS